MCPQAIDPLITILALYLEVAQLARHPHCPPCFQNTLNVSIRRTARASGTFRVSLLGCTCIGIMDYGPGYRGEFRAGPYDQFYEQFC